MDTFRTKFDTIGKPLMLKILFLISVKNFISEHDSSDSRVFQSTYTYRIYYMTQMGNAIIQLLFFRVINILKNIFNHVALFNSYLFSDLSKVNFPVQRSPFSRVTTVPETMNAYYLVEFLDMTPRKNNYSFHL